MARFPEDLSECVGFEWDKGNTEMNWVLHRVSRSEAEECFFNRPILVALEAGHSRTEPRSAALGRANGGRRLTLVFTVRAFLIRVISARDMSRRERRIYETGT
jgi:uncharacterized DUF497 family protein